jgi:hypothetical protein
MASYFKEEDYVTVFNGVVCRRKLATASIIKNTQQCYNIYSLHLSVCGVAMAVKII